MSIKKRYIWIALLILLLLVGAYAYRVYNRRPADLADIQATARVAADSLVLTFEKDESNANTIYLGKPIEVSGRIVEITNQQDTLVNVVLGSKESLHRVSCLMSTNQVKTVQPYKPGDIITLRGICNGFLMDVELNRCVVVK